MVSKTGPDIAHHLLAWVLTGIDQNFSADRCWSDVLNEIDSINPKSVIISSAFFSWLSEEQLQKLKVLLKDYSVRILIYFRSPFNWLLSRYNQNVKKGRYHRSFRAFIQEQSSHFISYDRLMQRYIGVFGPNNIDLRLFDKIKSQNSLEKDLIHMLGLDASIYGKYILPDKQNISLSSDITNMLRCLNFIQHYFTPRSMHSTRIKRVRNRIIRKHNAYKILNNIGKPIFNKPIYNKKDIRIYSSITQRWLPEFLRKYLNPEDWVYYK